MDREAEISYRLCFSVCFCFQTGANMRGEIGVVVCEVEFSLGSNPGHPEYHSLRRRENKKIHTD